MPLTRKLARVDLTGRTVAVGEIPRGDRERFLGGRGLNIARLFELTGPATSPLGPENALILGGGLLNGIYFGRMNISAKSPESGYLGDSNIGGYFPAEFARAGFGQMIITGRSDSPVYLFVRNGKIEFRDAAPLWGLDTHATQLAIREELGCDVKVLCIGPAGENMVRFASVASGYKSMAGRTGMGAVFGSKNLKAIAVAGDAPFAVHDAGALRDALTAVTEKLMKTGWAKALGRYGSPLLLQYANEKGFISYKYHQQTTIGADAEGLGAEALDKFATGMVACAGCPVHCRHRYKSHSRFGVLKGEGPEYATISSLGNQLGNLSLEAVLHLGGLCNALGIDTISAGGYIGWIMTLVEKGVLSEREIGFPLKWGDVDGIERLLRAIALREGFGDIAADGVFAADRLPAEARRHLMHIKNVSIEMTDERAVKAFALGLATATRGCCHMRSRVSADVVQYPRELLSQFYGGDVGRDHRDYRGKARMVHWHEVFNAAVDSAGICRFASVFSSINAIDYTDMAAVINAAAGLGVDEASLRELGERVYTLERSYIVREGIRRADDRLPDYYYDVPVPSGPSRGEHIDRAKFDGMLDEYYDHHGWDRNGVPTAATLGRLGLAGGRQ